MKRVLAYYDTTENLRYDAVHLLDMAYKVDSPTGLGIDPTLDEAIESLATKGGGRWWASGSGFGTRDIQFEFKSRRRARKVQRAIQLILGDALEYCELDEAPNKFKLYVLGMIPADLLEQGFDHFEWR